MAVKTAILAILSLGDAYGLQLRDELVTRAPHREGINVGQIYGTIDRLCRAGQVVESETTRDGLQCYSLTEAGRAAVAEWLRVPAAGSELEWSELLDQILVVASLPGSSVADLIRDYRSLLNHAVPTGDALSAQVRSVAAARAAHLRAVRSWLDDCSDALTDASASFGLSHVRPRRGRRAVLS